MNTDLKSDLARLGATESTVLWLEANDHRVTPYVDLLQFKQPGKVSLEAVLEVDGRAVAYVANASNLTLPRTQLASDVDRLRRDLSCRGDAVHFVVWTHGEVHVYPLDLRLRPPEPLRIDPQSQRLIFQEIEAGTLIEGEKPATKQEAAQRRGVHDVLFEVLSEVTLGLGAKDRALAENHDDVIALVGRALFTRFLIDRKIINPRTFPELYRNQKPESCFDSPEKAAATCEWLHRNFNGELLPLSLSDYTAFFKDLHARDPAALDDLSLIMHRAPGRQLSFELYWESVNFAHVPIGLLSQVYERNAHALFKDRARKESIYYTPRFIAEFMVNEAFDGIEKAATARVLDPAAGAGMFLVIAFRRLVMEAWKASGARPDTDAIRTILRENIFGFDINSWALRLAALSLYLTALELDPNPVLGPKLKFKALIGRNLFCTRGPKEQLPETQVLGSLGEGGAVFEQIGPVDLVIGNGPWTAWKGKQDLIKPLNVAASRIARDVMQARGGEKRFGPVAHTYENPDYNTDLPFVWKATSWVHPGGIIAFAMHGRLLFRRSEHGAIARDALFKAVHVTGILNGTKLGKSVWPGMDQPFCLLFARNETPPDDYALRYISPDRDEELGDQQRFRVDYGQAHWVQPAKLRRVPTLLKTLMVGTIQDADLSARLQSLVQPRTTENKLHERRFWRLRDYWIPARRLDSGQGFFEAEELAQQSAQFILDMKAKRLDKTQNFGFCVSSDNLNSFEAKTLHRPRRSEIYRTPLALISESPGQGRSDVRARLATGGDPIAYSQSFFGYTAHGRKDGLGLCKYLFVLANSDLFTYYHVLHSAKFAVERRRLYEEDIGDFPLLPYESLGAEERKIAFNLAAALCHGPTEEDWIRLNEWVNTLYGIEQDDAQVIADTLETRMPYAGAAKRANRRIGADDAEVLRFCAEVKRILDPAFALIDQSVDCRPSRSLSPWIFIDIVAGPEQAHAPALDAIAQAVAARKHATRIAIEVGPRHLRIGMLDKYRYWTATRGCELALEVLREYQHMFPVPTKA